MHNYGNIARVMAFALTAVPLSAISSDINAQTAERSLEQQKVITRTGEQLHMLPGTEGLDPTVVSDDPLGVNLQGVTLLNSASDIKPRTRGKGISASKIKTPDGVNFSEIFAPFANKPISLRSIVEMRRAVVNAYREAGYGLMSVLVPEQELDSGNLQLLINKFSLGKVSVSGLGWTTQEHVAENLQVRKGEPINTDQLLEDVNWLNLNPYRNIFIVAEPGKEFGETNLILRAKEEEPWSVYGGIDNNGDASTGQTRIFLGANVANLPMMDHQLSYQFTTSPEAFGRLDQFAIGTRNQAAYQSHDLVYFAPLPWRDKLTVRFSHIQSRSNLTAGLVNASVSTIFTAEYGIPLSSGQGLHSEAYVGFDVKRSSRKIYSGGATQTHNQLGVFQLAAGWRGSDRSSTMSSEFEVEAVISPGNIGPHNSNSAYNAYSSSTNAKATYGYLYGTYDGVFRLNDSLSISTSAAGQVASTALPSTETLSLGGQTTLRGYPTGEISGDDGLFANVQLGGPIISGANDGTASSVSLNWYGFADFGMARGRENKTQKSIASLGIGLDMAVSNYLTLDANVGMPMVATDNTKARSLRGNLRLVARY